MDVNITEEEDNQSEDSSFSMNQSRTVDNQDHNIVLLHIPGTTTYQIPPIPNSWPAFVQERLRKIPALVNLPDMSTIQMDITFRRQDFSVAFGSNPQALDTAWNKTPLAQYILGDKGSRFILGPMPDWNFFCPHSPCASGLIFRPPKCPDAHGCGQKEVDANGGQPIPRTVIIRTSNAKWLYVGEYILQRSQPLDEWDQLDSWQQDCWRSKMNSKMAGYSGRSVDEVLKALDARTAKLEVFTMECIGYETEVQHMIEMLVSGNLPNISKTKSARSRNSQIKP
ncbi:hypothetical protein FRB91_003609 [Serendipita sp. 411]|nr:hypothetical protein FRB91_003609 [Serendipita sp. 411]